MIEHKCTQVSGNLYRIKKQRLLSLYRNTVFTDPGTGSCNRPITGTFDWIQLASVGCQKEKCSPAAEEHKLVWGKVNAIPLIDHLSILNPCLRSSCSAPPSWTSPSLSPKYCVHSSVWEDYVQVGRLNAHSPNAVGWINHVEWQYVSMVDTVDTGGSLSHNHCRDKTRETCQ